MGRGPDAVILPRGVLPEQRGSKRRDREISLTGSERYQEGGEKWTKNLKKIVVLMNHTSDPIGVSAI